MCDAEKQCEKPENLKTRPEECTLEQTKECHGDANHNDIGNQALQCS